MVKQGDKKAEGKMAKRTKMKLNCNDCDLEFSKKRDLQQHRRVEHLSRRGNVCPICRKVFESDKRLKMHLTFHNNGGEFECFYCQKQFNKAWKMKIHLVNHSGQPPYICQWCGDDFLYPGKFNQHLKNVHDIWYACKECGDVLTYDNMEPHKCKIYGCKDCRMTYASRSELAAHVECHIDPEKNLVISESPPLHDDGLGKKNNRTGSHHDSSKNNLLAEHTKCDGDIQKDLPVVIFDPPKMNSEASSNSECLKDQNIDPKTIHSECHIEVDDDIVLLDTSMPLQIQKDKGKTCGRRNARCSNNSTTDDQLRPDNFFDQTPSSVLSKRTKNYSSDEHRLDLTTLPVHQQPKNGLHLRGDKNSSAFNELVSGYSDRAASPIIKLSQERHLSSQMLRSAREKLEIYFKVPHPSIAPLRKSDHSQRSLSKSQNGLNRSDKRKDQLRTKFPSYDQTDISLDHQRPISFSSLDDQRPISLESWLTADSFSNFDYDFDFGFEAKDNVGQFTNLTEKYSTSKKIPKTSDSYTTFEDLCQ